MIGVPMKIGIVTEIVTVNSLKYVYGGLEQALLGRHEIVYRPFEYFYASAKRQEELLKDFLGNCDAMVGIIDPKVLQARERIGKRVPMAGFLLGTMSRGAMNLADITHYLKSTDVLIGNCRADLEITNKFFKNAQTCLLPFAVDESSFYPLDERKKQTIKAEMGFSKDAKILLYVGRLTLEKNVHTLLKVFNALQRLMPNLYLILVGEFLDVPLAEFGVYSLNIASTLIRLIDKLKIPADHVQLLGSKTPAQLRDLYNVADVLLNMTLNHDENFGYSQVEAMACGTPVVGTNWGGLKDTIKHGETGYHVSTVVTDSGVKVNWWEAINRTAHLLNDEATLSQFSDCSRAHASENFSRARYAAILESVLTESVRSTKSNDPINITSFARQFWTQFRYRPISPPPYHRGAQAFEAYKELIASFTGATESLVSAKKIIGPQQLLVLAAPIQIQNGMVKIDDPIYPFELAIPGVYRESCEALLKVLCNQPVIEVGRLENLAGAWTTSSLRDALKWMVEKGILLRSKRMGTSIEPEMIGREMGSPLFSTHVLDHMIDVIMIR
jgi:glycosyltransferase involved in cell wall biosynthesis